MQRSEPHAAPSAGRAPAGPSAQPRDTSTGRFAGSASPPAGGRRLHRAKPRAMAFHAPGQVRHADGAARTVSSEVPFETEFDDLVAGFRGTRTVLVGPELAGRMLALNTGNRRVNGRRVDEFARAMSSGGFVNTGEPVIFSDEGILNDGQNRLHAIVASGVAVELDVRFGIPRSAFVLTNTGASRTAADVLSIRGVSSASTVAATVRLLMAHALGLPDHLRDRFDNHDVDAAFAAWPEVPQAIAMVGAAAVPAPFRGTALYAAVALAMRSRGAAGLPRWLEALATGLGAERDDPAHQLRERLLRPGREDLAAGRDRQVIRLALMLKSWALFRDGATVVMREFRWSRREPFPALDAARPH